jgi:transposase InsO family protein
MSKRPTLPNLKPFEFSGDPDDYPSWREKVVTLFNFIGLLEVFGIPLPGAVAEVKEEDVPPNAEAFALAWFVLESILPVPLVRFIRSCGRDPKKAMAKIDKRFLVTGQAGLDSNEDKLQNLRMRAGNFTEYIDSLTYLLDRIDLCRVELKISPLSDDRKKHFLLKGISVRDLLWTASIVHARTLTFDAAVEYLENWNLTVSQQDSPLESALLMASPPGAARTNRFPTRAKAKCSNCGIRGHDEANCFKLHPEMRTARPSCKGCGRSGHSEDRCYTLHPELRPASYGRRPASGAGPEVVNVAVSEPCEFAFPSFTLPSSLNRAASVADTACTIHALNNINRFVSTRYCSPKTVRGLNGVSTYDQCGDAHLWCEVDGKRHLVKLIDAAYIPSAPYNLISVPRLWKGGCTSRYSGDGMSWNFYHGGVNMMRADLSSGLPVVQTAVSEAGFSPTPWAGLAFPVVDDDDPEGKHEEYAARLEAATPNDLPLLLDTTSDDSEDFDDLPPPPPPSASPVEMRPVDRIHQRLGHLSLRGIQQLRREGRAPGVKASDKLSPCNTCARVNSIRTSFPTPDFDVSSIPLEVLDEEHADLTGPIQPPGTEGERYLSLTVDKASGHIHGDCLQTKDQSFESFTNYSSQVQTKFGRPIKKLWTDRGGEYVNHEFADHAKASGMEHHFSVATVSQQNGLVERAMRTVLSVARALLDFGSVRKNRWPDACLYAVYLINRRPSRRLGGRDRMTVWSGTTANLDSLRVFGCEVWRHIPVAQRIKLDDRAERCVFLGVETAGKSYRLWSISRKRVINAVSVRFNENIFPFAGHLPGQSEGPYESFSVDPGSGGDDDPASGDGGDLDAGDGADDAPGVAVPTLPPGVFPAPVSASSASGPPRRSTRSNLGIPAPRLEDSAALMADVALTSTAVPSSQLPPEPRNFKAAMASDEAKEWKAGCDEEYKSLDDNKTWELVDLPEDAHVIGSGWVFRRKLQMDGTIKRWKARFVARGYEQTEGVDFHETFSPVASYASIRLVLAIAAALCLLLHQMDVVSAFLQGPIDTAIYVRQPEGYIVAGSEHLVCRLLRSLYGLRQSPRIWWLQLDGFLVGLGFLRCLSESCIYVLREHGQLLIIAVYVDDLVIACSCDRLLAWIKSQLSARFRMKDEGVMAWCLGMRISRPVPSIITLDLEQYTLNFLERTGMRSARPARTPSVPGLVLSADDCPQTDEEKAHMAVFPFRAILGVLLYIALATRPDLSATVSALGRFCSNPGRPHWLAMQRVLRYLAGTFSRGLTFSRHARDNPLQLLGLVDADWGGDVNTRRSTSGFVFYFCNGPVAWCSRLQRTVALSSAEAEYLSLSDACKECSWLRSLLTELGFLQEATIILEDNQGAIAMANNPVQRRRTKHIDIRAHYIRQLVESGAVSLQYLPTDRMIADLLTKPAARAIFEKLVDYLLGPLGRWTDMD